MDNWKLQFTVMLFCALLQTFNGFSDGVEKPSTDWQNESEQKSLTNPLVDLMKRSKALRFYGLMGKRSATKKPFQVNRRNKGETFVGLMGRSLSAGESFSREAPSAATTEQGSPKKWERMLY